MPLGHSGRVTSVAFSYDGKYVLSGSSDNTIKVWNSSTVSEMCTLAGHSAGVTSVAFSYDGKYVLSGSWDRTIKVWDSHTGSEVHTLEGNRSIQ